MSKKTLPPNHADQHNRNNEAFWKGRGHDSRPADWSSRPVTHVDPQPSAPAPSNNDKR